jgi:hypothetical protein
MLRCAVYITTHNHQAVLLCWSRQLASIRITRRSGVLCDDCGFRRGGLSEILTRSTAQRFRGD